MVTGLDSVQTAAVVFGATVFILVVRLCRYERATANATSCRQVQAHAGAIMPSQDDVALLDVYRRTVADISNLEMPLIFRLSLEFALFRTYAIPSISALLDRTKRFKTNCGKRYDDTDLLIREILENPWGSERSNISIRRINAIHGQFQQSIRMDDMRYVLSVFVLEPIRWAKRCEWRELTETESDALFAIWTHIGHRMGITDIPSTLDEFDKWNKAFEQRNMVYAESNIAISEPTIELFLCILPWFMRSFGRQVALCLMDDRLRAAVNCPDPSPMLKRLVLTLLWIRKMFMRHLMLPRPRWLSARRTPFDPKGCMWKRFQANELSVKANDSTFEESKPMRPRYHIYNAVYKDGYTLESLGDAPPNQLYPDGKIPVYLAK